MPTVMRSNTGGKNIVPFRGLGELWRMTAKLSARESKHVPDKEMADMRARIAALKTTKVKLHAKDKDERERMLRQTNINLFMISQRDARLRSEDFFDVGLGTRSDWLMYHYAVQHSKARKEKEDARLVRRINNPRTIAPFSDLRQCLQHLEEICKRENALGGETSQERDPGASCAP
jgi:hypothetical protein